MEIAVLGVDPGKNSCSVGGLDAKGRVVLRRRMLRENVVKLTAGPTPCARECAVMRITWSDATGSGARTEADVVRICQAVREGSEER
jgi:hypothetical protein